MPAHSPKWANRPPRGPKEAPKLLFKNAENARTIRPKRSQASGWHAKRPDMQFVLCFTGQTGPGARLPPVFTATFWGSQGAPGRAPRGLHEASLQPCPHEAPKEAPKKPQEAPKRPPKRPPRGPKRPPRGPQEAPKRPQLVPPARWPTCTHRFARVHTVIQGETRFPFPAPTGFRKSSFSVCFTMVFEGFAPKPFCQFSKIAKTLGPFNKNSTSK